MLVVIVSNDEEGSDVELRCKLGACRWRDAGTKNVLAQSATTLSVPVPKEKATLILLDPPTE